MRIVAVLACVLLGACASIIEGRSQQVRENASGADNKYDSPVKLTLIAPARSA